MQTLVPAEIGLLVLGQPLPYDLYNLHGVLLVRAGSPVHNPDRLAHLARQRLYRPSDGLEPALDDHPANDFKRLGRAYDALLDAHPLPPPDAIRVLAEDLQRLTQSDPGLCVALANRLELKSLARRHALFVASVGLLLARHTGLDDTVGFNVACAALTMNLPCNALQDELSHARQPPDELQSDCLRRHPLLAGEALERLGVSDPAWLLAVRQHHENLDGSGYPLGLAGDSIIPEARLLRVADVWCALLSHRHNRIARYPRQAQQTVFQRERGRLDDALLLALRRIMGRYPPGTLVRLANRETAMVTRWFGDHAPPPLVVSVLRPSGDPLPQPRLRHTRVAMHGIRDYTWMPLHFSPLDWARIWSAG